MLMQEPIDLDEIRQKLKQNNLPQHLIDNFKALNKTQEEEFRKLELALEEDERLKIAETKNSSTSKDDEIQNDDDLDLSDLIEEEEEVDERSVSPIESAALPNKDNLPGNSSQRADTPQQAPAANQNKRKSRSGFGTRVSGHLRARNSNEVVGRPYFDDEDKSNPSNIKTGVAAEEIVSELIKSVLQPEFLNILVGQTPVLTSTIGLENRTILLKLRACWGVGTIAMFSYQNRSLKKLKRKGKDFQFLLLNL